MKQSPSTGVGLGVTLGLFLSWLANDIEELFTMVDSSNAVADRLERAPVKVLHTMGGKVRFTQRQLTFAIACVGVVILAMSLLGVRTQGRSKVFQAGVATLHAHVAGHAAGTIAMRGYSSGVVTALLVNLPYSIWARRQMRRAGILWEGSAPYIKGIAGFAPVFAAIMVISRTLIRKSP